MKRFLSNLFSSRPRSTAPSRLARRAVRPGLETLEDRLALSGSPFANPVSSGLGHDQGSSVARDLAGNVYVAGEFTGTAVFHGANSSDKTLTSHGGADAFVAMYDVSGNLKWVRQMGGVNDDTATGIAVGANSKVYVTGSFRGGAWFGTDYHVAPAAAITDGYVTKLDAASGNFQWAHQFDGTSNAGLIPRGVAVDSQGSAYATGYYWPGSAGPGAKAYFDPAHPTTPWNTLRNQINPANVHGCAFVVKLSTNGAFQWVRGAAGNVDGVNAYGVAVDASNSVYIAGAYQGNAYFGNGPLHPSYRMLHGSANNYTYVEKLSSAGTPLWVHRGLTAASSVPAGDTLLGIAVDGTGVYTTGTTWNSTYKKAFIQKFDKTTGALGPTRIIAGTLDVYGYGLAVDLTGHVYVAGAFQGIVDFGAQTFSSNGLTDAFIGKLVSSLNFVPGGSRSYGGIWDDRAFGLAVDGQGYVDTTGWWGATTLGADAFVRRDL